MRRPSRRWCAGLAAVAALTLALTTSTANAVAPPLTTPGVYVPELPSGEAVSVPTGVAVMIGQGTAAAGATQLSGAVLVTSADEFTADVEAPSDRLSSGAAAFFASGGQTLYVELTASEAAPSLLSALQSPMPSGAIDLVVVPALGQLSGADYESVAVAADQRAHDSAAVALLDPPDDIVTLAAAGGPAPLTMLSARLQSALPASGSALLFASGLIDDDGQPVPAAAAVAGLIAGNDAEHGSWSSLGGLSMPLPDLQPVWSVPNTDLADLAAGAVNPFRSVAGYGTVLWGDRTLAGSASSYLGVRQLTTQIQQGMATVTRSFVFDPNDAATWTAVTQALSSYLTGLYAQGALQGTTPASAYSVRCGLGTTMTTQDLLSGVMNVSVSVAIVRPDEFVQLSIQQQQASSG